MWEILKDADRKVIMVVLQEHPELPHIRSEDSIGLVWWAHEYGRLHFIVGHSSTTWLQLEQD
jgi:hypothetical protein